MESNSYRSEWGQEILSIPFSVWMQRANGEGRKHCTTRSKKYGAPGDVFDDGTGRLWRILKIERLPLWAVRRNLYKEEGFDSPEEFESLWKRLHRGNLKLNRDYYVHWYAPYAPVESSGGC